jgi:hypothetical protein
MFNIAMLHEKDPKQVLLDKVGPVVDRLNILNTQVLVAVYIRPEKTKGGIIWTDATRDEDQHQSKVGLILKKGPIAFVEGDEKKWFGDITFNNHDWIVFRPSDGWPVTINGVLCRMIEDVSVKMQIPHPDDVY